MAMGHTLLSASRLSYYLPAPFIVCIGLLLQILPSTAHAQVAPITPSGLNTQVSPPITVGTQTQYNITGGTRPGGGTNLFQSFGQFNVPANNIANFLNTPVNGVLPATSNILARVTGTNGNNPTLSSIFGTIQTTGFGNANLFLMNPSGFLFGPNATLNVGGVVAFTTADYLRLAELDGSNAGIFHADLAKASVLTSAPVAAFGFVGSNPAAIEIQGSQLTLATGKGLSLVGGNITIGADPETGTGSIISAPGGQINLVSVASPGEILYPSLERAPNINNQSFSAMGTIAIRDFATIDVSGNAIEGDGHAGSIRIRGGQLVVENFSFLTASTQGDVSGDSPGISVIVDGDVTLSNVSGIVTGTGSGTGRDGGIEIAAKNVGITDGSFLLTSSSGSAPAGNITIQADTISVGGGNPDFGIISNISTLGGDANEGGSISLSGRTSSGQSLSLFDGGYIQSGSLFSGRGGDIAINMDRVTISGGSSISANSSSSFGAAGNILITAKDSFSLTGRSADGTSPSAISSDSSQSPANISIATGSFLLSDGARIDGQTSAPTGGQIGISGTESITIQGGSTITSISNLGKGGSLELSAPNITVSQSRLSASSAGSGSSGAISLSATNGNVTLANGAVIASNTGGSGNGGPVEITATNSVLVSGGSRIESIGLSTGSGQAGTVTVTADNLVSLSGALTGLFTEARGTGIGGAITVATNQVRITDGAVISAKSTGSRVAGRVDIEGTQTQTQTQSVTIDGAGSGIFTTTSATGAGGNIFVNANTFTLQNDGTLSAATSGTAPSATGGAITVEGNTVQLNSAATITTATSGPGNAGNILVKADTFSMNGGATIAAASTGTGNAGTVTIEGTQSPAQSIVINGPGSGIFTNTLATGTGGNIDLNARTIALQNGGTVSANSSGINASATGGAITMNATDQVTMTGGSAITASSTGPGNAGNISINAGQRLEMQNSSVKTEAAQASGGNIDVQAIDQVRLVNSTISTSVLGGAGSGGNITIDPNVVVLQNSQIIAQAVQGAGGNITIFTPLFLADSTSLVSASSQFGLNGTVTIQSPTSNLSGSLGVLSSKTRQAQGLLTQRCAALANGQASSFVVAGREQLPADPGGWLTSPLAFAGVEPDRFGNEAFAPAPAALASQNTDTVSLRRLTPSGFLLAHFAESEATGCRS